MHLSEELVKTTDRKDHRFSLVIVIGFRAKTEKECVLKLYIKI